MKKNLAVFLLIAVISVGIGVYFGAQRWSVQTPSSDKAALIFAQTLPDTQDSAQALSQWKGKMLVVNFWATWCPPCVEEMPELSALQKEVASKNIQIIGIGIDSASNIKEFSVKHNISYPLYITGVNGTELARELGNQAGGLPYTVLVAPNGEIKKTYLGKLNMTELRRDLGIS